MLLVRDGVGLTRPLVRITSRMVLRGVYDVCGWGTLKSGATLSQVKIPNRRETRVLSSSILC